MNNNKLTAALTLAALSIALLSTSVTASAGTVIFNNNGLEKSGWATWKSPGYSSQVSYYGGLFDLDQTGGTYSQSLLKNTVGDEDKFSAFCLDPETPIQPGSTYQLESLNYADKDSFASSTNGIGQVKADHIRELMYGAYPVLGDPIGNKKALAVQIALWEIVREDSSNSYNVYDGDIYFTDDQFWDRRKNARELAQEYLDTYVGNGGGKLNNLATLTMDGGQDMLVQTVSAVPVPAAVWLFGSAFVGLVGFGRRRKQ